MKLGCFIQFALIKHNLSTFLYSLQMLMLVNLNYNLDNDSLYKNLHMVDFKFPSY